MSNVSLCNVQKKYGAVEIMNDLNLEVKSGEFLVLVGPSGCGKSTLLRMIAGLEEITDGTVSIAGRVVNDLRASQRKLSMVFQSYALYPHMNVRKNLAFGLKNLKMPKDEIERRVAEAARVLQIESLLERKPRQLSGGQKQRVAIGRAIVREPELFLFDEPLSNLDAELRVQMRAELAGLYNRLGTTMIYVTHDQVEAMTMATRIVVMRSGTIEQVGTPYELYTRPQNLFVAGFIGSPKINQLPANAEHNHLGTTLTLADFGSFTLESFDQCERQMTVCIRPEHFTIGNAGPLSSSGVIALVEYLGSEIYVHVDLPSGKRVLIHVSGNEQHIVGEKITFSLDPKVAHYFNEAGQRVEPTALKEIACSGC